MVKNIQSGIVNKLGNCLITLHGIDMRSLGLGFTLLIIFSNNVGLVESFYFYDILQNY